jgi:DNA-binding phage protein
MNTILLTILIAVDLILLGLVLVALRRKRETPASVSILRELDHEHRLIKQMREAVREDLAAKHGEMKAIYEKVATIATETDMELKSGAQSLQAEMEHVMAEARQRLEEYLDQIDKRRTGLSALVKKTAEERQLLQKALSRGEKLTKFFDSTVPYQDVLEELEDKKYVDARHMLARGIKPAQVARELGLQEAEVQLIASMHT